MIRLMRWALVPLAGLMRTEAASFEEVIPRPVQVTVREGEALRVGPERPWRVEGPDGSAKAAVLEALRAWRGGRQADDGEGGPVPLRLELSSSGEEGRGSSYSLEVGAERGIVLRGGGEAGLFYAAQSVIQVLPEPGGELRLEPERVEDAPRFAWRGFMLDESRHFLGKQFVMDTLRRMARYKLNRFHWHLTDSHGWRFETPGFPELTQAGAVGTLSDPSAPAQFHSRADIAEILALAESLHIEVIPEIDMPGHANAVLRAFPEHAGEPSSADPFTFNPVSPQTREFLQRLLGATAEVFPDATMIHYGGDEVSFHRDEWRENPEIMAWLAQRGTDDLLLAERAFNRDLAAFIHGGLGRRVGAWDEVALAGVPPEQVTLFWWRHDQPQLLADALEAGYSTVLCPRIGLYLDFVQTDRDRQGRRWGGEFCPLEQVYRGWRADADAAIAAHPGRILGVQGNLWTEQVASVERANYLAWPRLLAVAELGWTSEPRHDYEDFLRRLPRELERLRGEGVAVFDPFEPENSPEVVDPLGPAREPEPAPAAAPEPASAEAVSAAE